jgi:hypothetical protein
MVGVLAVAGLVSGSNVPDSIESSRLAFYHWIWPISLFAGTALALLALDLARGAVPAVRAWAPRLVPARRTAAVALTATALVLTVAPVAASPAVERDNDDLRATGTVDSRAVVDDLADMALAAGAADHDGPVVVLSVGGGPFETAQAALSLRLIERGVDVRYPEDLRDFVADEHLVEPAEVGSVVIVVTERLGSPLPAVIPGEEVGELSPGGGDPIDAEAHATAVAAVEGANGPLRPGAELADRYAAAGDDERQLLDASLAALAASPDRLLLDRTYVQFLLDYPLADPEIDPDVLRRLRDSLPEGRSPEPEATLRLRLVTGTDARALLEPGGWAQAQADAQGAAEGTAATATDAEATG